MGFNINTTKTEDVNVIAVSGDVDGNTSPVLQGHVLALVGPSCRLVLEMTNVPFMSSAGLRLLLLLYRKVTEANGQIVLVGLSEELQDTMSATGFLKFFTVCPVLDDALKALA